MRLIVLVEASDGTTYAHGAFVLDSRADDFARRCQRANPGCRVRVIPLYSGKDRP